MESEVAKVLMDALAIRFHLDVNGMGKKGLDG